MRGDIVTNCPEQTSLVSSLHGRRKNLYGSRHCVLYSLSAHTKNGYLWYAETRTFGTTWIRLFFSIRKGMLVSSEVYTHTHTHALFSLPSTFSSPSSCYCSAFLPVYLKSENTHFPQFEPLQCQGKPYCTVM